MSDTPLAQDSIPCDVVILLNAGGDVDPLPQLLVWAGQGQQGVSPEEISRGQEGNQTTHIDILFGKIFICIGYQISQFLQYFEMSNYRFLIDGKM